MKLSDSLASLNVTFTITLGSLQTEASKFNSEFNCLVMYRDQCLSNLQALFPFQAYKVEYHRTDEEHHKAH